MLYRPGNRATGGLLGRELSGPKRRDVMGTERMDAHYNDMGMQVINIECCSRK